MVFADHMEHQSTAWRHFYWVRLLSLLHAHIAGMSLLMPDQPHASSCPEHCQCLNCLFGFLHCSVYDPLHANTHLWRAGVACALAAGALLTLAATRPSMPMSAIKARGGEFLDSSYLGGSQGLRFFKVL